MPRVLAASIGAAGGMLTCLMLAADRLAGAGALPPTPLIVRIGNAAFASNAFVFLLLAVQASRYQTSPRWTRTGVLPLPSLLTESLVCGAAGCLAALAPFGVAALLPGRSMAVVGATVLALACTGVPIARYTRGGQVRWVMSLLLAGCAMGWIGLRLDATGAGAPDPPPVGTASP